MATFRCKFPEACNDSVSLPFAPALRPRVQVACWDASTCGLRQSHVLVMTLPGWWPSGSKQTAILAPQQTGARVPDPGYLAQALTEQDPY